MSKRKLTPEHKAKIAKANTGRKASHETRIKMSLARRAMFKAQQQARAT
jgi:hypothetical protein